MYCLKSARYLAQDCLRQVVRPGDAVIDATCGNGHDTLFLAGLVGDAGTVFGFDLQKAAIERTAARLAENGVLDRCRLYAVGHEHLLEYVKEPVRAAAFNLGWLPGSDKAVTTQWPTTQTAVDGALSLLLPGGVVTICAYPGHEAGNLELNHLKARLAQLRPQEYNVLSQRFLNAGPGAPECFVIQRMMGG